MGNLLSDSLLLLVPMGVAFYTFTYALWLWRKKNKVGAVGVFILAVISVIYPGFVLFFVHR
ncbi:MAG: hypothetical protein CVU87_14000 [Firmicutes bacterium HGW-Firmicutes-12]|jgi:hypothetical protein|nr:MAG: hypothetical protein CVU87_14000 [Firmicutes bacterium HGW-Firmicutes-12]